MINRLHYISQPATDGSHVTSIKNALDAGCKWIQLRIKEEPEALILAYALEAAQLCKSYNAKLIVNDHPEIALKAGADGVHLGLEDMPVQEAREIVGEKMIIGGTANTFEQVAQRAAEGVDYIGLGPYRFTRTKKKLSPILGLAGYTSIITQVRAEGISLPIIAVGGIEVDDVPFLLQTGVYGVAMSGAITHSSDRSSVVNDLYKYLDTNQATRILNLF
jgi:thiamine-phosphate pyrophosphorylase